MQLGGCIESPLMSDLSKLKNSDPPSLPAATQEVSPTSIDFLPHDVIQAIRDPGDWQRRTNALETLKGILEEVSDISALLSNFGSFVSFLVSLLDDSHFRVIHTTLQIIEMVHLFILIIATSVYCVCSSRRDSARRSRQTSWRAPTRSSTE